MSEREPELGLGAVTELDHNRITVEFPATRENRIYARGTPVLQRVQFNVGDQVATRDGRSFTVESVAEAGGLLVYTGGGVIVPETGISALTSVSSPVERLMAGQAEP
ncbi:MAG: RNA polymerase-associated protein RapA, partial [Cephaloticoccus sp.]